MATSADQFRPGDDAYPRSARVQADLRKAWKKQIKKLPPAQREQWLRSQEGISALGAQACHQLRGILSARQEALTASVASAAWVEAWVYHDELPPGLSFDDGSRVKGPTGEMVDDGKGGMQREWPDGRQYAVRLVLSQVATSGGVEPPPGSDPKAEPVKSAPTRRWTPPQAVAVEDFLDAMGTKEAHYYEFPPSPSARVFQAIEAAKGREQEQRTKAVSRSKAKRYQRQYEARGATVD